VVTFSLEPGEGITRLIVVHEKLADQVAFGQISHGWSAVLSNRKAFLETGGALPQDPWSMHPVAGHSGVDMADLQPRSSTAAPTTQC